jgi:hypothetical protein
MGRQSKISKRRLHYVGKCCNTHHPPIYTVRPTGRAPGTDMRICCVRGYLSYLKQKLTQNKEETP